MFKKVIAFLADESGPTATEYAVMLALIVVACLTAIGTLGNKVTEIFTTVADAMDTVGG